jgi:hypothetical protein
LENGTQNLFFKLLLLNLRLNIIVEKEGVDVLSWGKGWAIASD